MGNICIHNLPRFDSSYDDNITTNRDFVYVCALRSKIVTIRASTRKPARCNCDIAKPFRFPVQTPNVATADTVITRVRCARFYEKWWRQWNCTYIFLEMSQIRKWIDISGHLHWHQDIKTCCHITPRMRIISRHVLLNINPTTSICRLVRAMTDCCRDAVHLLTSQSQ